MSLCHTYDILSYISNLLDLLVIHSLILDRDRSVDRLDRVCTMMIGLGRSSTADR